MNQLNIISAAFKIHHLTNLNTYIIGQDGEFIFHHEMILNPFFYAWCQGEDVFTLHTEMKQQNNQLYAYTNQWGLYLFGLFFFYRTAYTASLLVHICK